MHETLRDKLVGPVFPVVIPFKDDRTIEPGIDYTSLEKYLNYLIDNGAQLLMVASATSRFAQLTTREICDINRSVLKTAKGRALAIPSTPILGSTQSHVDVANEAKSCGAKLIICEYPWRYQSDRALIDYFKAIADTGLGIVMHITPGRSEVKTDFGSTNRYDVRAIEEILKKVPSVVGMKEASGDREHSKKLWTEFSGELNIIVAGRASETFLEAPPHGVAGFFSGAGNIHPEKDVEIYSLVRSGKFEEAAKLVAKYETPFLKAAKEWGWHASLKAVLAGMDLMENTERPPMVPVSDEQQEILMKLANEKD